MSGRRGYGRGHSRGDGAVRRTSMLPRCAAHSVGLAFCFSESLTPPTLSMASYQLFNNAFTSFHSRTQSPLPFSNPPPSLATSPDTLACSREKAVRAAARAAGGGCASPRMGGASSFPPLCFAPCRILTTPTSAAELCTASSTAMRGLASKCAAFRRGRTASWGKRLRRAQRRR